MRWVAQMNMYVLLIYIIKTGYNIAFRCVLHFTLLNCKLHCNLTNYSIIYFILSKFCHPSLVNSLFSDIVSLQLFVPNKDELFFYRVTIQIHTNTFYSGMYSDIYFAACVQSSRASSCFC